MIRFLVGFDFQDIYEEAVRTAPKNGILVEVGVAFGKSLAFLARQAIDQKRDDLTIYGVDPWIPEDWLIRDCKPWYEPHGGFFNAFGYYMHTHAPEEFERICILRMTSSKAAQLFDNDRGVEFVFIDGDHSYAGAHSDVSAWKNTVNRDGVIAGHDYTGFPGVEQAVNEHFPETVGGFEVRGSSWWRRVT